MRFLAAMSFAATRLPESRTKIRAGRAIAAVVSACGIDPVCVVRLRDGSLMELDPRSRTEAEAFWNGEYESAYVHVLKQLIDAFGTPVYDIGANVGLVAIPLARHAGSDGTVVSFEPVPENFARLQRNAALNHLDERHWRAFDAALGAEGGMAAMARETHHGATSGNARML